MYMGYFRRPLLAGSNFDRLTQAKVRGTKRRALVAGVATFAGVAGGGGDTLAFQIDGVPFFVTLSTNTMAAVLSDLNTAIAGAGSAYDEDGAVAIKSVTVGYPSSVEITGGTGSVALGFDVGAQSFESAAGDVSSVSEGAGSGVPFGVAFPNKHDDLNRLTLTRPLARISGNLDSLHADLMKPRPVLMELSGFTISGDRKSIALDAADKVFTGFGFLSATSVKEDLAPYFQLLDSTTKQPVASRVVAVVRGTPVGDPVYVNTANFAADDGGNVLGLNLSKYSSAITSILNGQVVKVSGATFLTDVAVGDVADITGATNVSPWSNNGKRWIVESIADDEHLVLRPMTKEERSVLGTPNSDSQPVLELNPTGVGFGTLTIYTGTWCDGVTLVVRPPIPKSATVVLLAAGPSSHREESPHSQAEALHRFANQTVSDLRPQPDGLILAPYVSFNAGLVVDISAGTVRRAGRVLTIPAHSLTMADNTDNFVYWDEADGIVKSTVTIGDALVWDKNDPAFPSSSATRGHLLAKVTTSGGVASVSGHTQRQVAEDVRPITVGWGGQFFLLNDAISYVNAWANAKSDEFSGLSSGLHPHFEIVLVSDSTTTGTIIITAPGLTIRGVTPDVTLALSAPISFIGGGTLKVSNLILDNSGGNTVSMVAVMTVAAKAVVLENIRPAGSVFKRAVVASAALQRVVIDRCHLFLHDEVVYGTGVDSTNIDSVTILNSVFDGDADLSIVTDPDTWACRVLHVSGCLFYRNVLSTGIFTGNTLQAANGTLKSLTMKGSTKTVHGNTMLALTVLGVSGAVVSGNRVVSTADPAVLLDTCTDVTAQGNYFETSTGGGPTTPAVDLDGCDRCRVLANSIKRATGTRFIRTQADCTKTLIGLNHFTGVASGIVDELSTTYYTADPSSTAPTNYGGLRD